jgi:hypothetical protein
MLHQSGMYRIAPTVFPDAFIFGTWFGKVYAKGKRVY